MITRSHYRLMHLSNLLVSITGLLYAWARYLVTPTDEWAVVNHPWQPHFQHFHVLTAPSLVFMAGIFWVLHSWPYWKGGVREGRRSGLSMMSLLMPMIISGYAIQVSVHEGWRLAWVIIHVVSSLIWIVGYTIHWVSHRRRVAKSPKVG